MHYYWLLMKLLSGLAELAMTWMLFTMMNMTVKEADITCVKLHTL